MIVGAWFVAMTADDGIWHVGRLYNQSVVSPVLLDCVGNGLTDARFRNFLTVKNAMLLERWCPFLGTGHTVAGAARTC